MEAGELKRRFGKRVQTLREARKLTQEQLADRIGRSVDTVSNIERGLNATRIEVAYAIANELGVELSSLFASDAANEEDAALRPMIDLLTGLDPTTVGSLTEIVRLALSLSRA